MDQYNLFFILYKNWFRQFQIETFNNFDHPSRINIWYRSDIVPAMFGKDLVWNQLAQHINSMKSLKLSKTKKNEFQTFHHCTFGHRCYCCTCWTRPWWRAPRLLSSHAWARSASIFCKHFILIIVISVSVRTVSKFFSFFVSKEPSFYYQCSGHYGFHYNHDLISIFRAKPWSMVQAALSKLRTIS